MIPDNYTCRRCHTAMHVPDGMDPLDEDVRYCDSCATDEIERLRASVDRLPQTADGVPIAQVRGEQVWRSVGPEGIPQGSVSFRFGLAVFRGATHDEMRLIVDCYSTREAAEEARKR